jgi:hypothetical protein
VRLAEVGLNLIRFFLIADIDASITSWKPILFQPMPLIREEPHYSGTKSNLHP